MAVRKVHCGAVVWRKTAPRDFDVPGFWVQPGDDVIAGLFRLLFRIGRTFANVRNVGCAIVSET
jgi:hypothetical protein